MTNYDGSYVDSQGYEHRYQQHSHDDDGCVVICAYCYAEVPGCEACPVPPAGDDEAWGELAAVHGEGCEWIATRAHRR